MLAPVTTMPTDIWLALKLAGGNPGFFPTCGHTGDGSNALLKACRRRAVAVILTKNDPDTWLGYSTCQDEEHCAQMVNMHIYHTKEQRADV